MDRVGLVATNSIRGGTNRRVLDKILRLGQIFDAWSNEPWVIDGAAVRVSLVCFSAFADGQSLEPRLDGVPVDRNYADLTAKQGDTRIDLTQVVRPPTNLGVAFQGVVKRGSFDISGDLAREWLQLPANPNGRANADVLKPRMNGMDLTRRPAGKWIIEFGNDMDESEAAFYETPFAHIAMYVKPARQKTRERESRELWFRHWRCRPEMWRALNDLSRCIATCKIW